MNRLVQVGLGALWFGAVFLVSFYVTFPTDAIKQRIRYEVFEGSDGALTLELESVSPWWVGLALHDVRLFTKGADPATGEPSDVLAFISSRVRARSSVMSLLSQTPSLNGSVDLLDGGSLSFDVETGMNKKGTRLEIVRVLVDGPQLAISDLGAAAGLVGSGSLDVSIDLDGPDGMRSADGEITLKSSGMSISELGDMLPPLGFDIPIEKIDLQFDVSKGRAKVKKGDIQSGFGKVELDGEITLREDVARSTYRFDLVISQLSPPDGMEMLVEGALASAKWADNTYHYSCTGSFERSRGCVPQRERSSRTTSARVPTPRPSSRRTTTPRPASGNAGTSGTAAGTAAGSDDLRERLRQRNEERERRLKEQEAEREELGYDENDEELEIIGYEDAENALEDFFENEIPMDELEQAFEDAFEQE